MRDQRDPTAIGEVLFAAYSGNLSILTRADNLRHLQIRDYAHDETSQSHAQRAYREEHEQKAAQGVRASIDLLAYLDHPEESQAHPASDAADVDLLPQTLVRDLPSQAGIDRNGDLHPKEAE